MLENLELYYENLTKVPQVSEGILHLRRSCKKINGTSPAHQCQMTSHAFQKPLLKSVNLTLGVPHSERSAKLCYCACVAPWPLWRGNLEGIARSYSQSPLQINQFNIHFFPFRQTLHIKVYSVPREREDIVSYIHRKSPIIS